MDFLTYARLKATVTSIRLGMRLSQGLPKSSPDEVLQIPSRDPNRTIKAHVYKSASSSSENNNSDKPAPILVNFHGSGFVLPLHGSDDYYCRLISSKSSYSVLDIQYRLAPERPFPAALEDVEDVVKWVLNKPKSYDQTNLSLSGFSAGANLALAASAAVFPKDTFRSVLAFYPPCDLSIEPKEKKPPQEGGKPIPAPMARLFDECYIPPGVDTKDPRISPGFADAKRFPARVMVVTCGQDTLAVEAEELASKIEKEKENGGEERVVRKRRIDGVDHGWDKKVKEGSYEAKMRDEAYELALEVLGL